MPEGEAELAAVRAIARPLVHVVLSERQAAQVRHPLRGRPAVKRSAGELLADMNTVDSAMMTAEAAKRQRVAVEEPSVEDDPVIDAAMAALVASVEDDDDAMSSSPGSDVAAPTHKHPLDAYARAKYTAAVRDTIRVGEEVLPQVLEMIANATAAAAEGADDPTDTEEIRLVARAALVAQHKFRTMLFTVSQTIAVACDSGYHAGENGETYEAVRNDWCHVTFGEGPYRVDFTDDGGCDLHLARINKETSVRTELQPRHRQALAGPRCTAATGLPNIRGNGACRGGAHSTVCVRR